MKSEPLKEFRSTLNMPELSELELGKTSHIRTETTYLNLFGDIPLEDYLPVINFFIDNMRIKDAYVWLSKNYPDFLIRLSYNHKVRPFTADLSPIPGRPEKYKMNYPEHYANYSDWQFKLKELLVELKLYFPVA